MACYKDNFTFFFTSYIESVNLKHIVSLVNSSSGYCQALKLLLLL
jgi:hypothetical protein